MGNNKTKQSKTIVIRNNSHYTKNEEIFNGKLHFSGSVAMVKRNKSIGNQSDAFKSRMKQGKKMLLKLTFNFEFLRPIDNSIDNCVQLIIKFVTVSISSFQFKDYLEFSTPFSNN